jgi:hypothetical protein
MRNHALIFLTLSAILVLGSVPSVRPAAATSSANGSLDWSKVALAPGSAVPPPRDNPGMVYDPLDGYMLLYGGQNNVTGYLNDTWTFSHDTWTQLNPSTNPGPRSDVSMAYDPADGYVLLYGGESANGDLNDTWAFAGGTWTRLQTTTTPPIREDAPMVYDAADGYILLFAGVNEGNSTNYLYYNDTWTFKSGKWTMLLTTQAPTARGAPGLVYDPASGYTLLFGGSTDYFSVNGAQSDSWKYERGTWTQLYPSGSSDHRDDFGLVWDPAIAGDLFYGGWDPGGVCGNDQNDTRIYRQDVWREVWPLNSPGERSAFGLDYDPIVGSVILFGGKENLGASPEAGCGTPVFLNDTWQYSLTQPSTNNGQNGSSLPFSSSLMYGALGVVVVAGASLGTYGLKRRSNGKKNGIRDATATGLSCQKCGTSLPEGSAYCGKCGQKIEV